MDGFFNFGYGGHGGSMVGAIIERLLNFLANTGIEKPMVSNMQTLCVYCHVCLSVSLLPVCSVHLIKHPTSSLLHGNGELARAARDKSIHVLIRCWPRTRSN